MSNPYSNTILHRGVSRILVAHGFKKTESEDKYPRTIWSDGENRTASCRYDDGKWLIGVTEPPVYERAESCSLKWVSLDDHVVDLFRGLMIFDDKTGPRILLAIIAAAEDNPKPPTFCERLTAFFRT